MKINWLWLENQIYSYFKIYQRIEKQKNYYLYFQKFRKDKNYTHKHTFHANLKNLHFSEKNIFFFFAE